MATVVRSKPSSVYHRRSRAYRWLLTQVYAPAGAGDAVALRDGSTPCSPAASSSRPRLT